MGKGLMLLRGDGLSWLPRPAGIGLGSCKSCRLHANAGGQLYGVGGVPVVSPAARAWLVWHGEVQPASGRSQARGEGAAGLWPFKTSASKG